jgi:DNA-binding GntR family transcriptional regulator
MPLSINALATKFSVSRKHVLTMLRDAETEGLLARGGAANDEVSFLRRGREALEIFLANVFLYQAACASEAYRISTTASAAVAAPVA